MYVQNMNKIDTHIDERYLHQQTHGQNLYRIDAYLSDKSSQKVSELYCK